MADLLVEFNQHKKTPSDTLGVLISILILVLILALLSVQIVFARPVNKNQARTLSQRLKP
jgi:hypothetical protein